MYSLSHSYVLQYIGNDKQTKDIWLYKLSLIINLCVILFIYNQNNVVNSNIKFKYHNGFSHEYLTIRKKTIEHQISIMYIQNSVWKTYN